jgi:hypothetical protein
MVQLKSRLSTMTILKLRSPSENNVTIDQALTMMTLDEGRRGRIPGLLGDTVDCIDGLAGKTRMVEEEANAAYDAQGGNSSTVVMSVQDQPCFSSKSRWKGKAEREPDLQPSASLTAEEVVASHLRQSLTSSQ